MSHQQREASDPRAHLARVGEIARYFENDRAATSDQVSMHESEDMDWEGSCAASPDGGPEVDGYTSCVDKFLQNTTSFNTTRSRYTVEDVGAYPWDPIPVYTDLEALRVLLASFTDYRTNCEEDWLQQRPLLPGSRYTERST